MPTDDRPPHKVGSSQDKAAVAYKAFRQVVFGGTLMQDFTHKQTSNKGCLSGL